MTAQSTTQSEAICARARQLMPGGVNSPVRAFGGVGGTPRVIREARGSRVIDVDGNEYIDYVGSWGPMILGHAHPRVIEAVQRTAAKGTSFGAPTQLENEMAELVIELVPGIERVRFVNSGTEAGLSAVRLARGATGRRKIVKMIGCYHGHVDALLVKAGSGVATFGLPDSPGVPEAVAADTISVPYNDLKAAQAALEANAGEVAAIMLEPVAGNMGLVPPLPGYLQGLRNLCDAHGVLLVFDEVMTCFRVGLNCAQGLFDVTPDLTMLGKIVGGGMPVGAYGGSAAIMDYVAPVGPVYQAGTLSGNPLGMAAGAETLRILKGEGVYEQLEAKSAYLSEGLATAAAAAGIPVCLTRQGSMMGLFFQSGPVNNFDDAKTSDTKRFAKYFHGMLAEGIYLAPSQFEAGFMSLAHSDEDLERTIEAAAKVMKTL